MSASLRERRVVIIGAGCAGLTLALALKHFGARCALTIVERQPRLARDRYGVTLAPNGLRTLAALGLLSGITRIGSPIDAVEIVDGAAHVVKARFEFAALPTCIPYAIGVLPGQLSSVLEAALGSDVDVHYGEQVVRIDATGPGGPYQVVTENGHGPRTLTADVVVGADGVHSMVRPYVTGERAQVDVDEAYQIILGGAVEGLTTVQQHVTPGRILGLVPVARDRTFIFWLCHRRDVMRVREQPLSEFKAALVGQVPALETALSTASTWDDVFTAKITLTRSRWWNRGGIVLIGDTVHAITPSLAQGANMALVDAWALAARLAAWSRRGAHESLEPHLQRFVSERRAPVRLQCGLGRLVGRTNFIRSPLLTQMKLRAAHVMSAWRPTHLAVLRALTGL